MPWISKTIVSEYESNFKIIGDDVSIENFASIETASKKDLTFCSSDDISAKSKISNSDSGIILCHKNLIDSVTPKPGQQLVFLNNPKLVFIQFIQKNFSKKPNAIISKTVKISESAKIGKNCYIDDYVTLGPNSDIGDNSIIFSGVSLSNCSIGENCIIHSGTVIGMDGFSYDRKSDLTLEKFPHFGKVLIGKNVEVNSNCTIARGSLSDTIIEDGTKFDALVHVAHNSHIGKNCMLTAGTIIGGSSIIGDNCWLGLNSTILDGIEIQDNVIIGAGATVIDNISKSKVIVGNPGKPISTKLSKTDLFRLCGRT